MFSRIWSALSTLLSCRL